MLRLWAIQTRRNWMNAKPRRGVHCPTGVAELCSDNSWKRRVPWYSPNLKSSIWDGYPLYTSSLHHFKSFLFEAIRVQKIKKRKHQIQQEVKKPTVLPTSSLKNSNCWIHPSSTSSAGAPAWFFFNTQVLDCPSIFQTFPTSESQLKTITKQ